VEEAEFLAVLEILNAWADADMDRVRAEHAELKAQVLPRLPPVLPPCKCGRPAGHPGRHTGHSGRAPRALKASGQSGGQAPRRT
jgi:hypothetical protein